MSTGSINGALESGRGVAESIIARSGVGLKNGIATPNNVAGSDGISSSGAT